jgi:DNA-binding SARP family transcriptional activator
MHGLHVGQSFDQRSTDALATPAWVPAWQRVTRGQDLVRLDIQLLGELRVFCGTEEITPSPPKPRQILAMLALQRGRVVSVDALIEELWGDRPPRSAMTTLQTYVMHLRTQIAAGLRATGSTQDVKNVLVTRPAGYLLNVVDPCTDVACFNDLVNAGNLAYDEGDLLEAGRTLRQALLLWRGPALMDIKAGSQLCAKVTLLNEGRLSLLQQVIDVELRLGLHQRSLGELAALTMEYPMHEGFQSQYMLALYRSGQRDRALTAYQRLRSVLANELGLEPAASVQQLHSAILNSDPALQPGPQHTMTWAANS